MKYSEVIPEPAGLGEEARHTQAEPSALVGLLARVEAAGGKLTAAQMADIEAHIDGLTIADTKPWTAPRHGWTCFHCGETFRTLGGGRLHFGEKIDGRPACVGQFWLILHEPGCVPERKGPWPDRQLRAVLREFIAARPTAYIDVLTVEHDGPNVGHGPEVLQMLDGRSMSVGRRHNASTAAAHAGHHVPSKDAGHIASGLKAALEKIGDYGDRYSGDEAQHLGRIARAALRAQAASPSDVSDEVPGIDQNKQDRL